MTVFSACILALALLGCSGDGTTLGPDGVPPTGEAPPDTTPTTPTLAQLSREIFTPNCAFSGCHSGAGAAAGMSLAADRIAGQIIGVVSPTSGMKRVDPGNPEGSYLLKKLRGDTGISGGQMPLGDAPLSAAQIALVRAWIAAGAPL
ncbi:MAG: hypothetical protein HYW07_12300 [Candidatus Latescibacteria bacterium]|nr:hypothetical protein [Candidatus Latescibacterota bacterium]